MIAGLVAKESRKVQQKDGELIPRAIGAVGLDWPYLTNHFLLLEATRR